MIHADIEMTDTTGIITIAEVSVMNDLHVAQIIRTPALTGVQMRALTIVLPDHN